VGTDKVERGPVERSDHERRAIRECRVGVDGQEPRAPRTDAEASRPLVLRLHREQLVDNGLGRCGIA
jgi:hypothetical protein